MPLFKMLREMRRKQFDGCLSVIVFILIASIWTIYTVFHFASLFYVARC